MEVVPLVSLERKSEMLSLFMRSLSLILHKATNQANCMKLLFLLLTKFSN